MSMRNYIRPEQWGDKYDPPSPPHTEPHQRASWGLIAVALLFAFFAWLLAPSAHAQTASWFTATVTKGISPVSTTLSWTCPLGSVSATASSTGNQPVWTGTKALSGSQLVTGIRGTGSYKLDCVSAAGTTVTTTLTWTAPTLNTDGSTLTNLAGYRYSWGTSDADVAANFDAHAVKLADPKVTSATLTVPVGTLSYAVRAYSATGVESSLSNVANKTGVGTPAQTFSQSITVTVDTQPAPPVLATVDTTAYTPNKTTNAIKLAEVGTVPLGVSCKPEYDANGLNVVPRSSVKFTTLTKPLVVVAKCG